MWLGATAIAIRHAMTARRSTGSDAQRQLDAPAASSNSGGSPNRLFARMKAPETKNSQIAGIARRLRRIQPNSIPAANADRQQQAHGHADILDQLAVEIDQERKKRADENPEREAPVALRERDGEQREAGPIGRRRTAPASAAGRNRSSAAESRGSRATAAASWSSRWPAPPGNRPRRRGAGCPDRTR